ncbi:MAG: hypothetical protein ACYS67_03655 [Planctomycetota bacterium]|jgi:hypothetical protein
MRSKKMFTILVLVLVLWLTNAGKAAPMGTAWTYQGRLMDANFPADGIYDFIFGLFGSQEGPSELGALTIHNLDVIDGYFTVELDFGSDVFDGSERWLQIEIRPGELEDPNEYTLLNPRQKITPMPYALQTRGIFVNSAGQVGIGTKIPQVRLSLGAEIPPNPRKLAVWDGIEDFYGLGADWGRMTVYANNEEKMTITDTGNVGIGTTDPGQKLDVDGGNIIVQGTDSFDAPTEEGTLYLGSVHHYIKGVYGFGVKLGTYAVGDVLSIKELSGNVGIGTTNPTSKLDVAGPVNLNKGATGPALRVDGAEALWYDGTYFSWGYGGTANYFADNVGIGTTTPAAKLDVVGRIRVSNSAGDPLVEIGEGLDYAEGFDVSESTEIDEGSVLIIDADNPGKLALSKTSYDTKVAGIVAGAEGLGSGVRLGAGQFDYDVALAGRVYCKVDATKEGVQPGDLLTTSDMAGHARKATDYTRAQGAILGKAMESLEKGQKGKILVLVTLQ